MAGKAGLHAVWERSGYTLASTNSLYAGDLIGESSKCVNSKSGVISQHGFCPDSRGFRYPIPCHFKMKRREQRGKHAAVIAEKLIDRIPVTYISAPDMVSAKNAVERLPWIRLWEKRKPSGKGPFCTALSTFHLQSPPLFSWHRSQPCRKAGCQPLSHWLCLRYKADRRSVR